MLSGGYAVVQQALGAEAAGAVSQAACLARQRGHAQVTPLHVASVMLFSAPGGGGLLRAACIRSSHPPSHPVQLEGLQLCLEFALSRLPMAWPPAAATFRHRGVGAPVLALSNALMAALKRAQAHGRRGTTDGGQRQPPMIAVKVELEQLAVSILDDPSVDRAMREAGFSGSRVKANVGKGASPEQSDSVRIHRSDGITSPCPINKKVMATQTSPGAVWDVLHQPGVVPHGSLALRPSYQRGDQACQAKPREAGWSAFVSLTRVATATSWLQLQHDAISTSHFHGTGLQQPTCRQQKFSELTAENLKILCDALELRVPRHKDIIPAIAGTVLQCRSGMRRPAASTTWLLFRGKDVHGKKAMAQELAKLVFGSNAEFAVLNSSKDSSCSAGHLSLKRHMPWDIDNGYVGIRLFEAILENRHRVMFIDDVDKLDPESEIAIENVITTGRIMGCNGGGVVSLEDAIVVLSSEASESRSLASSTHPSKRQRTRELNREEDGAEKGVDSRRFAFDLNAHPEDVESTDEGGVMGVLDGVFCFN
ncbi:protein SMAX1-LIKE 3-like [Aegilops tauschii subsp. strangulata]|uniref:protein SMAX1-LIKE 3-like n=1 Tax=Aegilops tauschii subsp. strangulata TaxID=200361 RepID=UPI00084263FE|nr:protein SMAX1-LIKE 3-like [Aegilops tauschii subsp. strangulata]XP_044417342.1 protein SMAX1-LIKE 3-like [Triticum aestivum]